MDSVTFVNFLKVYPNLPSAGNNRVFRPNAGAVEVTSAHYLTRTKCVNCDMNNYVLFLTPDPNQRGWFGGCG